MSGEVDIGAENGGATHLDMVLRKTGSWEVLEVSHGNTSANEFIIYAYSPGDCASTQCRALQWSL